MEFNKLAVEKCEDIQQQLFDIESEVNDLKNKVKNYIPEPFVPPIDPNKLPEIEFEGIDENEIYQSMDRLTWKCAVSNSGYSYFHIRPIHFRADAGTNVKITLTINYEISLYNNVVKFQLLTNTGTVLFEENINSEIGAHTYNLTHIMQSDAECGNIIVLKFLKNKSSQAIGITKVDIIIEGQNVCFTTTTANAFITTYKNNYYITKIVDGEGYYQIADASTLTEIDETQFQPTEYTSNFQIMGCSMIDYAGSYYPEDEFFLALNELGQVQYKKLDGTLDTLRGYSSISPTTSVCPCFRNCANNNVPIFVLNALNNKSTRFSMGYYTFDNNSSITSGNITIASNFYVQILPITSLTNTYNGTRTEIALLCKSNGTNYFRESNSNGIEVGFGTNATVYYPTTSNNIVEIYLNVYGKIIKKTIQKISSNWQITSETTIGNYKKYYKGINNDYFVITHSGELQYYKN